MNQGWVKLHRSVFDNPIFSFKEPDKTLAWIYLFTLANHKDNKILIKHTIRVVKRGQLAVSQRTLQKQFCWSQNKLKRFLGRLKSERMIDYETDALTTVITICNYEHFQSLGLVTDVQTDALTDAQTNDKQECKNEKNVKNKENNKEKIKRVTFVPPSLNQVSEYCTERKNTVNPNQFIDHYQTNGWMRGKSKVKDWKACIRTWEAKSKQNNSTTNNSIIDCGGWSDELAHG